jgi:hypothetical protein
VKRLYYYGARYYDPRTSVWLSVDPLADKKPWFTPYAYCANNPLIFIDPDGRDEWLFDERGHYVDRVENKDKDIIHIVNNKDDRKIIRTSQDYKNGTIKSLNEDKNSDNKKVTILNITDEDNAYSIFKFFAQDSPIEWAYNVFDMDDGIFVSTGHVGGINGEHSTSYLINKYLQFSLKENTHNHPVDEHPAHPSGWYGPIDRTGSGKYELEGDVGFADVLVKHYNKYFNRTPKLYIYDRVKEERYRYDGNTTEKNFRKQKWHQ